MSDEFNLARFVEAQQAVYETALRELEDGCKGSHWMWFIFPQLESLGRSPTAKHYGIRSFAEAAAYLNNELLGQRLLACTEATIRAKAASLTAYLGSPDDLKFRSSMTLFCVIDPEGPFKVALDRWCNGAPDPETLRLLNAR